MRELRAEFDSGQRVLGELEAKQADVKNTMLRISGAIQILEELMKTPSNSESSVNIASHVSDSDGVLEEGADNHARNPDKPSVHSAHQS